jgi:hypothetical protein
VLAISHRRLLADEKQTSLAFRALLGEEAEHNYDHPSKPPLS